MTRRPRVTVHYGRSSILVSCGRPCDGLKATTQVFGVTCRLCLKRMVAENVAGARARLDELKATDRGDGQ